MQRRRAEPAGVIGRLVRDGHDEHGYVAMLAALMFSTFAFGCAALGVDVARMYVEVQRVQKAADAGSLAGVVWLPNLATARSEAIEASLQNGYPNDTTKGSTVSAVVDADFTSRLRVTVCSTIQNTFGVAIGVGSATICRSSTSDFTGPQPMGNPCNTLGNEPPGTTNAGPIASQLKVPTGADCPSPATTSTTPQFWMTIAGPEAFKTQGDKYGTRVCKGGTDPESGCSGTSNKTNDDFDPAGYFLLVRIDKAAVAAGKTFTLQIYDPAFIPTGALCTAAPSVPRNSTFPTTQNWNPFTTTDGQSRYHVTAHTSSGTATESPNQFCSGDAENSGSQRGSTVPTITSYGLRRPVASKNPLDAVPQASCTKQYPGYNAPTTNELLSGNADYDVNQAAVFHEWNTVCSFKPDVAGDWYLQVRTNVAMQSTTLNDAGGYKPSNAASSPMYSDDDDSSVLGNGTNMYAVRVYSSNGSAGDVAVAAYGRLPIYANADNAQPTFNLIRVLPAARGKTLVFKFYDVGDAADDPGATMKVLPPKESTGTSISGPTSNKVITGCTASGYKPLSVSQMSNCTISGIYGPSGWNGKEESFSVPIPSNYTCSVDTTTVNGGGCWFRVQMNFNSDRVTDVMTWTAEVTGAPVRIVK